MSNYDSWKLSSGQDHITEIPKDEEKETKYCSICDVELEECNTDDFDVELFEKGICIKCHLEKVLFQDQEPINEWVYQIKKRYETYIDPFKEKFIKYIINEDEKDCKSTINHLKALIFKLDSKLK